MGRRIFFAFLVCFLCLTAVSCRLPFQRVARTPQGTDIKSEGTLQVVDRGPEKGGVIRLFSTTPDTLNPILTQNVYVRDFSSLVFEGLVKLDERQQPVPVLAESWSVSSDGLTWNFRIRPGVLWHDGAQFTAHDVVATMDMLMRSDSPSTYKRNVQNIVAYAALNDLSLRIVLSKPNSFLPEMMTFPIVPSGKGGDEMLAGQENMMLPIGTGPYKYAQYEQGRSIVLQSNEAWWGKKDSDDEEPGEPYITSVEVSIHHSATEAAGAFQTRDTDLLCMDTSEYEIYTGRTDLTIRKYPGRTYEFVAFNLRKPLFADVGARKAVSASIRREELMSHTMPGSAIAAELPIYPGSWLNDGNSGGDAEREKSVSDILTEYGWKQENGVYTKRMSGVRKSFSFELLVNNENKIRYKAAVFIAEELKRNGIHANVVSVPWEEVIARLNSGDFDAVVTGCLIPSVPDISFMYSTPYFSSYLPQSETVCRNIAGYDNAEVNHYIQSMFAENDAERKKGLLHQAKAIIAEEVPYVGLFFRSSAVMYNNKLRGTLSPCPWDRMNGILGCYIPQS